MSEAPQHVGAIAWHDLTVPDAGPIRDFYAAVCGWSAHPVEMGGYADFSMRDGAGRDVAGVCFARGPNVGIPAQWLMYVTVPDFDAALREARARGGVVEHGPRDMGGAKMAVVRDPAGAVFALYG